jgi:nitroimidazol reductase NimA-like FMN-containing flavoprotein (pyridoxamine 5'-phosphate oxidase superfamily)
MLIDEGLELLTDAESLELLGRAEVGRVGVTVGALPAIFPVNFRMFDGAIIFRTGPGSKLAAAVEGAVVAFEVDDSDTASRTGWSVLVVGEAEVIHDLDVALSALAAELEPYAGGKRAAIVRITPGFISGRRIVPDDKEGPPHR